MVTSAVFAPDSPALIEQMERHRREREEEKSNSSLTVEGAVHPGRGTGSSPIMSSSSSYGYVLVSADFNGCIKVFVNRVKPKHSSLPVSALN